MTSFAILLAFILGAAIPSFLLWRSVEDNRHLLNVILKRHAKAPTVEHGFVIGGQSEQVKTAGDRKSLPTQIDSLMANAMAEDTAEFERLHPKETVN